MKNTKWLIASLVAIIVSAMMAGCGGSAGTPPDSNTTTGGGTEVANTKLTIQKSDLGDCQDMRVQVWATKLTYQGSPPLLLENDPSLYFVKEYNDQNISDNGGADGNYTIDLGEHITINKYRDSAVNTVLRDVAADDPELSKPIRLHATVFCGERSWGMKSLSYDMDNVSQGFYKAQNSLVMMCVKTYPGNGEPFPDELAPEFDTHRMVFAISSSKSIDINSSDFDTFLSVDTGYEQYEAYTGQYTNNLITDLYHYDTDDDWEFDSFGYVDSGTKRMTSFNQKWVTAGIRYKNLKKTYTDIVKNSINGDFLWGIDRCPSYMQ